MTHSLEAVAPGTTVILDDFDDSPEHERLAQLLRRPPRGATIAIAYRRLPPALIGALEAAARRGVLTDVALAPLTPAEADELLGRPAGALYRLSGGNPFYLLELAGSREHVPPAIAAAIGQELAALSAPARRLAFGAAVASEIGLAGIAAEVTELETLDELAGLLTPRRGELVFRHPIVRRAVYEASGPGWRLTAHARVAEALRNGPCAARAHHLERCANAGDEEAIAVLVQAARDAAPDDAARWYAAAQRLKRERRHSLLVPLADALAATGEIEQALAALREALALVPGDARLIAATATCEQLLGPPSLRPRAGQPAQ